MGKILVNGNIVLRGVKVYAENGVLMAELIGEAASNVGPVNFNISPVPLDFNMPENTAISAFCFRDGKGRVGYNFNFGDVMFDNSEEDTENNADEEPTEEPTEEENISVETEEEHESEEMH